MKLEDVAPRYGGFYSPPVVLAGTAAHPLARIAWVNHPPNGYILEIRGEASERVYLPKADAPALGLVKAIDVSSYQPANLTGLIALTGAQLVIVRLYQPKLEAPHVPHSRAQLNSAISLEVEVAGYFWPYHDSDLHRAVDGVVALAASRLARLPFLGLDIEAYTDGSIPTPDEIAVVLAECDARGVTPVIYTSAEMWRRIGNPMQFSGRLCWIADYNGEPTLDVASVGGMLVVGHQYATTLGAVAIDLSVFSRDLLTP